MSLNGQANTEKLCINRTNAACSRCFARLSDGFYCNASCITPCWPTKGVIHEKIIYCGFMHKRLPLGYTMAKTGFKKICHFAIAAKKGVIHEGVIRRGGNTWGIRVPEIVKSVLKNGPIRHLWLYETDYTDRPQIAHILKAQNPNVGFVANFSQRHFPYSGKAQKRKILFAK